jgi:hypothetical protein
MRRFACGAGCSFVLALVLMLAGAPAALAAGGYSGSGNDISWPQCGGQFPSGGSFGIVGVTGGRAFTQNACLAAELQWAGGTGNASVYMNLNYAAGSSASNGASGPYGSGKHCRSGSACYAENYGWNAAKYALAYAGANGVGASTWWLDIETANTWNRSRTLNQAVIQGALDCLLGAGPAGNTCANGEPTDVASVGIYSTPSQWSSITGGWVPHDSAGTVVTANWVAGASAGNPSQLCGSPLYSGGSVWLTQYVANGFDQDYACGA